MRSSEGDLAHGGGGCETQNQPLKTFRLLTTVYERHDRRSNEVADAMQTLDQESVPSRRLSEM